MKSQIVIGITECSKHINYQQWMESNDVEVIQLSYTKNNFADIEKCTGIIMSGGEDIHPEYYKKPEYLSECGEINQKRDEFEWKVLEYSKKENLPILGVCRGLQITNVFFGGTLIPDLQNRHKENHNSFEKADRYHAVNVIADTAFHRITNSLQGEINSSHHQAADVIGAGLKVSALSSDNVIEALERINEKDSYVLLVQWHPERMNNMESVFSKNIKADFLDAVRKHIG
jgi:putative glutamine amidotransferase